MESRLSGNVTNEWDEVLRCHQLDSFEAWWNTPVEWFEAPNERRGGWSGVGRIGLQTPNGEWQYFFIKKQQNHGRRTLRHPFRGEPTFRREYRWLCYLDQKEIDAPQVVFYGEHHHANDHRAVLVTKALAHYLPLETILQTQFHLRTLSEKKHLLRLVGKEVRHFHDVGLVHRALYPKHIFVDQTPSMDRVAFIDLEKARKTCGFKRRSQFDLAALNRHTPHLSKTMRLRFFLAYLGNKKLTHANKKLLKSIVQRSMR